MIHYKLDLAGNTILIPEDQHQPDDLKSPGFLMLLKSDAFGGEHKQTSPMFMDDGTFTVSVANRLKYSPNTLEAATKLVNTFVWHCDTEHTNYYAAMAEGAKALLAQLESDLQQAGDNSYQIDIGV